jgi:uncharacterized protein with HEPN domain
MDNSKNDLYFARKIHNDILFIIEHSKDLSEEELGKDEVLLDSIMFRFIQISESIKRLSNEFKIQNNQIPWISITGLRNKIVHEYGKIDLTIIYKTVKHDIINIETLFSNILNKI